MWDSTRQRDKPRLLITRPRVQGRALGMDARLLGWEVVLEPLLIIRWCRAELPPLERLQGLLFTSANGVRAWARSVSSHRDLPVYAIGDTTAQVAHNVGFEQVTSGGGDRCGLVEQAALTCRTQNGILLHVAGAVTAGPLVESLIEIGFDARRVVLYETSPVEMLSPSTSMALLEQRIQAVALLSQRSARILSACLRRQDLLSCCSRLTLLCLSEAIAQTAQQDTAGYNWEQIRVASYPDRKAWLGLLREPIRPESQAGSSSVGG